MDHTHIVLEGQAAQDWQDDGRDEQRHVHCTRGRLFVKCGRLFAMKFLLREDTCQSWRVLGGTHQWCATECMFCGEAVLTNCWRQSRHAHAREQNEDRCVHSSAVRLDSSREAMHNLRRHDVALMDCSCALISASQK